MNTPTGIEAQVCQDIADRQAQGIEKYGTTVAENPLSLTSWLIHAYEECLDQAIYLKRAIAKIEFALRNESKEGANHERERIFILAADSDHERHDVRALGPGPDGGISIVNDCYIAAIRK